MLNFQNILKFADKRWYIYNNQKGKDGYEYDIILDFETGLVWVNGDKYKYSFVSKTKENIDLSFEDGRFNWRLPYYGELNTVVTDHTFPLHAEISNNCIYPKISNDKYQNKRGFFPFFVKNNKNETKVVDLQNTPITYITNRDSDTNLIIAVTDEFKIKAENYLPFSEVLKRFKLNITDDRRICSYLLRLYKACVSLSVIFQLKHKYGIGLNVEELNNEAKSFYYKVDLFEKDNLTDINAINKSIFSFFDYDNLIDTPLEYCQRLKELIGILLNVLDEGTNDYKKEIGTINSGMINLKSIKVSNEALLSDEKTLLYDRINYFINEFSVDAIAVQTKLLSIRHQAEDLEKKLFETIDKENSFFELGILENEKRASFGNISQIAIRAVTKFMQKIGILSSNQALAQWICNSVEECTEKYKVFKTTYREELRSSCKSDSIEEKIWQNWYADWQSLRFKIEQKVQPIIEKELHERIAMIEEDEISVAQQIISELEVYRDAVDSFYLEERKGIYQNFVFQSNGDVQDKLETESKLYKLTAQFQTALQSIIFNCAMAEDRIFILNWANDLLDIQIDDILALVSDNDLDKISDTILTEFSELKKKNYEIYLADAKSYGEEQARRDKQFNSLLFKMRKGLK